MTRTLIRDARAVHPEGVTDDSWVLFEAGLIAAAGTGADHPAADRVVSAGGRYLTAGFIDLHCHGGGGRSFDEGMAAVETVLGVHASQGTTRMVASLVTAPLPQLCDRMRELAAATGVLGLHLEGPFLAASHRGAHDLGHLLAPSASSVDQLLEAGGSRLVQVTIAPELPGATEAIRRILAAGVKVAIGHTAADYASALAAFDAGARILTHSFNGMPDLLHRAPGPVAAAMRHPDVTLELIADGVHVHPELVRVAFASAPGRIALITDAMAAAGAGDGTYSLGSQQVIVEGDVARLADGSSIAGSVLTLGAALRNAVAFGVPLVDAVTAITATPARAAGVAHRLGRLAPGLAADAVLLDDDLQVAGVWRDGHPVVTPG